MTYAIWTMTYIVDRYNMNKKLHYMWGEQIKSNSTRYGVSSHRSITLSENINIYLYLIISPNVLTVKSLCYSSATFIEWHISIFVSNSDACPAMNKVLSYHLIAPEAGVVQGRVAVLIDHVWVRPMSQQLIKVIILLVFNSFSSGRSYIDKSYDIQCYCNYYCDCFNQYYIQINRNSYIR